MILVLTKQRTVVNCSRCCCAVDPCSDMKCEAGQECDVNDDGEAECRCISDCPYEEGPRVQVREHHRDLMTLILSITLTFSERLACPVANNFKMRN